MLLLHNFAERFPNSGSLIRGLNEYYQRILYRKNLGVNLIPQISILTDIAYHNPKSYPICAAILSKYISLIEGDDQRLVLIEKIKKKFSKLPNTGHLQIWLQRISITFDPQNKYDEPICRLVAGEKMLIWNVNWLSSKLANSLQSSKIIDQDMIDDLDPVIPSEEVQLFLSKIQES
jgi:hypothetical protein